MWLLKHFFAVFDGGKSGEEKEKEKRGEGKKRMREKKGKGEGEEGGGKKEIDLREEVKEEKE